jgi:hypothetical protein
MQQERARISVTMSGRLTLTTQDHHIARAQEGTSDNHQVLMYTSSIAISQFLVTNHFRPTRMSSDLFHASSAVASVLGSDVTRAAQP